MVGCYITILKKVHAVFIDFQQIQTDDVGGLILCLDAMLEEYHGSHRKDTRFAQNISFVNNLTGNSPPIRLPRGNSKE